MGDKFKLTPEFFKLSAQGLLVSCNFVAASGWVVGEFSPRTDMSDDEMTPD